MNVSTRLRAGLRSTIPVLALLALAACTGDAPLPMGLDEATSGVATEQSDATTLVTTNEEGLILELCKNWLGPVGTNPSAWFDFEVEVERDAEVIVDEIVIRNSGTGCGETAPPIEPPSGGWQENDMVTITEIVPDGYELGLIALSVRPGRTVDNDWIEDPESPTVTFRVGDVKRVYFKNRDAPFEEPETFTFELCKTWVGLGDGPDLTWSFTLEVDGEAQDPVLVEGFDCVTVGPFEEGTDVTVAEIVPDGFELGLIEVLYSDETTGSFDDPTDPSYSFEIPAVERITYGNREVVENGGGEGCTPGFWRQPQHYEFWTERSPGDEWVDVFASLGTGNGNGPPANNGNGQGNQGGNNARSTGGDLTDATTLGEAVQLRGGGINALARHAVAALLNAANPDVDYDLTVGEILDLVNDAIASGEYEDAKNILEGYNEQGCDIK